MRVRFWPVWLCCIASILGAGCGQKVYRAETTLHPDGSVERAIFQPRDETPDNAQRPDLWTKITASAERPPQKWDVAIAELPAAPADDKHPYLAASGKFKSPENIPPHFLKKAPPGSEDSRLIVEYEKHDYAFVIEHHWRESLTDTVSLPDMHRACDELAELLIDVGSRILEEGLGTGYDVSNLHKWAKTEGKTWFTEAADVIYETAARREKGEKAKTTFRSAIARISARHGLKLADDEGHPLEEQEMSAAFKEHIRQLVLRLLRRTDGKPVDPTVVQSALIWLGLAEAPKPSEGEEQPSKEPTPLERAAKRVIEQKFETEEAFQERVVTLAAHIVGLYNAEIFGPPRNFHYSLKAPGRIVETNGNLLSENEVDWTFNAKDAFPFGYTMECRSLALVPEAQKLLLKGNPLEKWERLVQFRQIVRGDEDLQEALRDSVRAKSLKSLDDYRSSIPSDDGNKGARQRLERLYKVLNLAE